MVGKVGLTVGKLGDGPMANGFWTGGATMVQGGGGGALGCNCKATECGWLWCSAQSGGCNPSVAPGCTPVAQLHLWFFYKGEEPWSPLM